jgi:ATP-dependent helicase/DNAse subunit B
MRHGLYPATLDQVRIGKMERIRTPKIRCVFVLGAAKGASFFRVDESILTDRERLPYPNTFFISVDL